MNNGNSPFRGAYHSRGLRPAVSRKRPLIGITGNYGERGLELAAGYYQSVYEAGGTPVAIPPLTGDEDAESLLDDLDGIIFSGGGDLNPLLVGEEPSTALHGICPQRDEKELLLMQLAMDCQLPMLCICRGIQLLAVVQGGNVIQDLASSGQFDGKLIKHSQDLERSYPSHTVRLAEGSMLQELFHTDVLSVNSFHHQAAGNAGNHMRIAAQSPDGVIEAIESTEPERHVIGVQWHPECFILRGDRTMMPLFEWLCNQAAVHAKAKEIHQRILSLDTHCDTPMLFSEDFHFERRSDKALVDLHKMQEGRLDATIMAAYIPQGELTETSLQAATDYCNHQLDGIDCLKGEFVDLAVTPADILRIKQAGKKAVMRGIENGYALGNDLKNVERFRNRGVVYMTLCHNGDNLVCDSARKSKRLNKGVSPFGEQVIREMNRVGMMVDLSHAGEESFWNALEMSATPIVCSHASCNALCPHPRNLTDDQLRALARVGGVCQITLYPYFLREDGNATIHDAIEHLNHAIYVMGIDHVGIGTDFDGDGGVPGMADASQAICFTRQLLRHRYSEEDISKIWGGNFLRVMQQVIDHSLQNH